MPAPKRLLREMEAHLVELMVGDPSGLPGDLSDYLSSVGALRGGRLDPVRTALACVEVGMPPERAAAMLDWRGFESFVAETMAEIGLASFRGVSFSLGARRWQVDVLAGRPGMTLSVEVKMWSRRPAMSGLRAAVRTHSERTRELALAMPSLRTRLPVVERPSHVVPVVVTWFSPEEIIDGVPLVPLRSLSSFLSEVDSMPDSVVGFPSQASLSPSPLPDSSSLAPLEKVR